MKISKISFKNIHSLRGEHHIDFCSGPLAEGGLFAITGATGSGKSTLLDVITLALYNRIPRMDGTISKAVIDGEGGIMTRNALDCYAEVEYIVNRTTYRSHWAIERNRNNNLNDRKQEIFDVVTGEIIASGKSTVPSKNEELIGLSYDQFVKAMVLSQGEFSKLLKAPRDQRNKLLEDITGAKDYRAIGIAVFRRFKSAADACKAQEIRLGEIEVMDEESKKELITEEATLNVSKIRQKKSLDDLKETIENKKGIVKNQNRIEANEVLQKQLTKAFEVFKEEELLLTKHVKYAVYLPLIIDFEQQQKELNSAREELDKQKVQSQHVLKNKTRLLEEATAILKKPVIAEDFSTVLSQLRQEVLALQNAEALAENQVKLHLDYIKTGLVEVNKKSNRLSLHTDPEKFIADLEVVLGRIDVFLKDTKAHEQTDVSISEERLNNKLGWITDLKVILTQHHSELKNKKAKEAELLKSQAAAQKYRLDLNVLEKELKKLVLEVEKLTKEEEDRKKHQSLESHRNGLKAGEPCPLCGALEHPYAVAHPIHDLQAEILKSKNDILNTKLALKTATQTNLENEHKNSVMLNQSILDISKAIEPHVNKAEHLCKTLEIPLVFEINKVMELGDKLMEELKLIAQVKEGKRLKELLLSLKNTANQWNKSLAVKTSMAADRKKLYSGNDIENKIQNLITQWTATVENQAHVQNRIVTLNKQIKAILEEYDRYQKQLQVILDTEGISTLYRLKDYILSEKAAEDIRQKKQNLQLKEERLNAEKESALKELEHFKKRVTTSEPLSELELKSKQMEDNFSRLNEKIGSLKTRLEADKKAKEKQKEFLNQLKGLQKEEALWKTMNDLIGDATGKKFSNFVQDLTLEQLIGYTNLRLKDLSDRYLLDIPTAEEGSKNDSLKVFDRHQGDARRSINTLSGGETFMVSLAMAFALSDLAAKNVKIESIFIDEGFGTLDPDTLNQAITILEKMQNEGDKSIGVISHVEALKERITTQIRLEKMGSGYSTIEIV